MSTWPHTAACLEEGGGWEPTGMSLLNIPYGTQGVANTFQLSP